MKKIIISLITIILLASSCATNSVENKTQESTIVADTTKATEEKNTTIETKTETKAETVAEIKEETRSETKQDTKNSETYTRQSRRADFSFDPKKKFVYTGNEPYYKDITEAMLSEFGAHFEQDTNVEIPTPYIVRIDDEDKNDIRVYGDFYIYGYRMNGMIFECVNGGSFPGCIRMKDDGESVSIESIDVAEDGSNYDESLLKICDGDESLKKDIDNERFEDGDRLRIEYVKMYIKDNNLKVSGIKDYGWPVILFDDISNANFVYNFYDAYFEEFRQEDTLNDFFERVENLKKKYIVDSLLTKISDQTLDMDCDPIIGAQDVTETMLDSLKVTDMGDGKVQVTIDIGDNRLYTIDVKIDTINGKKKFADMDFTYSE